MRVYWEDYCYKPQLSNYFNTLIIFNVLFIRYEPFDFHKECSKMRWERLSILTDKLKAVQDKFG